MGILQYIEYQLGKLFYSFRGRDNKLFCNGATFENIKPNISLTAPECDPSGSQMLKHHTAFGDEIFPELKWTAPDNVKENVLVVQDPDIPLPFVATHGLFYSISASVDSIKPSDVQYEKGQESQHELAGPFRMGKNTPRPSTAKSWTGACGSVLGSINWNDRGFG